MCFRVDPRPPEREREKKRQGQRYVEIEARIELM